MRTILNLLLIAFACVITSCNGDTVYKEFNRDFSENRWMKDDDRIYNFTIEEAGLYDVSIDFSHVYETPLNSAPVKLILTSGKEVLYNEPVSIMIRDENGKQVGDCTGDYCDITQKVLTAHKFDRGEYGIRLTNEIDFSFLPHFLGIGIKVTKSKS